MNNTADKTILYELLGHEVSLYSGKARAYLRYKKIPFEESVSAERYADIEKHIGRKIIPIVVTPDGEYIQDTTVIIDRLEQQFPEPSVYPATPLQRLVALLLECYGDEWLVMAAMHYRWQFKRRNLGFILRQFGDVLYPNWPAWAKPFPGIPVALFFAGKYRTLFGLSDRNEAELEKSTEQFLIDFDRHLEHHDFLLGSRPSIGDFGLVGPLYAHFGRDPYPKQWMQDIAPRVYAWTRRMQNPTGNDGAFLPDDEVPDTLYPLLRRMFTEQLPPLLDTLERVADWVKDNPDRKRLPRVIGKHDFALGDVIEQRCIQPYQQWMLQRPLRFYQSLGPAEKARIDPVMQDLGGLPGLHTRIPVPLEYVGHRVTVTSR